MTIIVKCKNRKNFIQVKIQIYICICVYMYINNVYMHVSDIPRYTTPYENI